MLAIVPMLTAEGVSSMKVFKVSLFFALLVALCLPAFGQTQMLVDVPFNFVAGGKSLPAGHYNVSRTALWNDVGWCVRGYKTAAVMLTSAVESSKRAHPRSMVFVRTGKGYSLAQIWTSEHEGRELLLKTSVKTIILTEEQKSTKSPDYVEIAGN